MPRVRRWKVNGHGHWGNKFGVLLELCCGQVLDRWDGVHKLRHRLLLDSRGRDLVRLTVRAWFHDTEHRCSPV